jgi:TonB-dependent receptor
MKKILTNQHKYAIKYILALLIIQCFQTSSLYADNAPVQNKNSESFTLQIETKLGTLFTIIEKESDVFFTYNNKIVNLNALIKIEIENGSLEDLLAQISKQTGLEFKQINNSISVRMSKSKLEIQPDPKVRGMLGGIIADEQTGERLPGATIRVADQNYGGISNLNGEFTIILEEGEYNLVINYLGYEEKIIPVIIEGKKTKTLKINLTADAYSFEGIIIKGYLQGQQRALNQQKNAVNIKNIVDTDQIGRFPDSNTAEALQRIPGINIDRNGGDGEGRYVGVRGLPGYFTTVSINGEQIPSPEGDVRQTALDAIPADQLAYMEVSKALTPDMDGDAIAGTINLVTRSALSRDLELSGTIGSEIQQNNPGQPGQQYALQMGKRFGGNSEGPGKFGVLLNTTFYKSNRNVDMVEQDYDTSPSELIFEEYELEDAYYIRERLGINGKLDYKPNDNNEFYFNGIYTQLYELDESRRWRFNIADASVVKRIKYRQENQGVQSYNIGGKHNIPSMKIDYEASVSLGNSNTPYEHLPVFGVDDEDLQLTIDRQDPYRPVITSATLNNQPFDWNDDSNYRFLEYEHSGTTAKSQNNAFKFNIEVPFKMDNGNGSIKFGTKVRNSSRKYTQDFFNLYEYDGNAEDAPALSEYNFTQGGDRNFNRKLLGGDYTFGDSPEWENIANYVSENSDDFENSGLDDLDEEIAERNYEINENLYAAYLMGTMDINKLQVLGGIRFEATTMGVKTQIWDSENDAIIPVEGDNKSPHFLPMLHFKYALSQNINLRAATTFSYARPNFEDIVSDDKVIDREDREAYIGNINLEPVSAFNFDLFAEYYFTDVGIMSAGFFYKKLDNFIYIESREETFLGEDDITVYQSVNGDVANLLGMELALQKNLTFLPSFLSGLGIYANYTYTIGEATYNNRADRFDENDQPIINEKVNALPGQSEHIINMALSYTKGGFQARVMANYNSSFIDGIGINSLTDEYVNDRWQFDASLSQEITPTIRLYGEFVNITNAENRTYFGKPNIPMEIRHFGFWTRFGVKFDL